MLFITEITLEKETENAYRGFTIWLAFTHKKFIGVKVFETIATIFKSSIKIYLQI